MGKSQFLALGCFWLLGSLAAPCSADEVTDKGRVVFQQHQHSVVTVQTVIKARISMAGNSQTNESRHTVSGTVVESSGLVALSLSAADPSQTLQKMAAQDPRVKVEAELSEVKMLLEDGTEVPAEIAGRDLEQDLAFVRPKAKLAAPLRALDLTKAGKADVLDQVIALNRLGSAAGRAYSASVERIAAIVEQPRRFYIPDANMTTATLGAPAFTLDGKVLGIFVIRSTASKGARGLMDAPGESLTGIILPAEEVLKAARKVTPADKK